MEIYLRLKKQVEGDPKLKAKIVRQYRDQAPGRAILKEKMEKMRPMLEVNVGYTVYPASSAYDGTSDPDSPITDLDFILEWSPPAEKKLRTLYGKPTIYEETLVFNVSPLVELKLHRRFNDLVRIHAAIAEAPEIEKAIIVYWKGKLSGDERNAFKMGAYSFFAKKLGIDWIII
jgi:hypothetical protein